jgi:dTDP-4-dehydrorhamnose reductase
MSATPNQPMRFLVIGASGFIGRHLMRYAAPQGCKARGTHSGRRPLPMPKLQLGQDRVLDCVDRSFLEGEHPCGVVYATTFGPIDDCCRNPQESRLVNVEAVLQVMTDLRRTNVRHIFLSTSAVFDGKQGGYAEGAACNPLNLYATQKRDVELWLNEHLPEALVLRIDKVVGTDPIDEHLFSQWRRLAAHGQPIRCVENMVFSPTLVDDVARGIVEACRRGLSGLYHLAPDQSHSRESLARLFIEQMDAESQVVVEPAARFDFAEPRPLRTDLDGSRFRGPPA